MCLRVKVHLIIVHARQHGQPRAEPRNVVELTGAQSVVVVCCDRRSKMEKYEQCLHDTMPSLRFDSVFAPHARRGLNGSREPAEIDSVHRPYGLFTSPQVPLDYVEPHGKQKSPPWSSPR
jgi:hypothetical protein